MLLRFAVKNHLSLRNEQELSLVASSLKDDESGLIEVENVRLLPSIVIYGANASGKSNLLNSLQFMRNAVVHSHERGNAGDAPVRRRPFALDGAALKQESEFSIDFIADNVRYSYGFRCTDSAYTSEWLYQYPNGRSQMLFEREKDVFTFGRSLKGRNKVISDLTRDSALFVSVAWQNSHDQLSVVANYFAATYGKVGSQSYFYGQEYIDPRTIKYLSYVGTGIFDYRTVEAKISEATKAFQLGFVKLAKESFGETFEPPDVEKRIELGHRGSTGLAYLPLARESSGTKRLLDILGAVFNAIDEGTLVVIDEIDVSLHTLACEGIINLFKDKTINKKGAQLIATTHDTNLLRSPSLRRDQVWFAEKNEVGESHIYPLTDIHTRVGDNLEKGYLQGRFGAVPFSADPASCFGDEWLQDISRSSLEDRHSDSQNGDS
ncbi:AAA family ATPase [Terrihabitans sp. B22-R8]|uniref:AAA family ATPase n=1 Tax=Terrihabitans sp. B22-R8 TaxID=3425128 RepID=UPI00403C9117